MPSIREIAYKINELSASYKIGNLQEIRKRIKQLNRRPGSKIFAESTIHEDWAFHYGGRKELQFNIGEENEGLRYGIAFSLEPSQTLPDISILFPHILRFNQFFKENSGFFSKYRMWYWQRGIRSGMQQVNEIGEDLLIFGTFIFIGKIESSENINYQNILETFDEMLIPYIYVEKEENSGIIEYELDEDDSFIFNPNEVRLVFNRSYSTAEKEINLSVRHSLIQKKLSDQLITEYGRENVSVENNSFGKKIDIVLRKESGFVFYEIKICGSAKACIREAIGQLLEYGYWPGKPHAEKLVIVGEYRMDLRTENYLEYLKNEFGLPIDYHSIEI